MEDDIQKLEEKNDELRKTLQELLDKKDELELYNFKLTKSSIIGPLQIGQQVKYTP